MGTVNLYCRGKQAAAQRAIAAMGAKFIHPIASECPKKPVAIRNTTATMMRRSAGIIPRIYPASKICKGEDGKDARPRHTALAPPDPTYFHAIADTARAKPPGKRFVLQRKFLATHSGPIFLGGIMK